MAAKNSVSKNSPTKRTTMIYGKAADSPKKELGVSGLKRQGNRSEISEEWLTQLSGPRGKRIYREMRDNDPTVGAILYAIETAVRGVDWKVVGNNEETRLFVEQCLGDMSHTWEDLVAEILSMLTYGFSFHEIVYKKRLGNNRDSSKRSKYNDGKIGWRKIPIRAQETIDTWDFDDQGGIVAAIQVSEPKFQQVPIPIERGLQFRTGVHKGNPEGRSILRNSYRSWFLKKRLENIEAVGIERDLAGIPIAYVDTLLDDKYRSEIQDILRNVRRDEQEGIYLPLAYDENGNQLIKFDLLSSAGTRQLDVTAPIERYDRRIASTVLADFIFLGQMNVGSFALSSDKTELFSTSLKSILGMISSVFNMHGIPRLLEINGMPLEESPTLFAGDVETADLEKLSDFISSISSAGMPLFPDDDLENWLRKQAHFPPKSPDSSALPVQRINPPNTDTPEVESEDDDEE